MTAKFGDAERSIGMLREDAIERGLCDLAIAYGWSQIRFREEYVCRQMTDLERYKMVKANDRRAS